jgi:predicted DNA binding CopG/RHH family protein
MAGKLVAPKFKSRAEELAWYDQHWQDLEREMEKAIKTGTAIKGLPVPNPRLVPVTIRILEQDLSAARRLAAEKGMRYQTYIPVLLHQALRQKATGR